jgi:hypothetical protein
VAYQEPTPPVINAIGPSRPATPPDPIVIADAMSFTSGTRARMKPSVR